MSNLFVACIMIVVYYRQLHSLNKFLKHIIDLSRNLDCSSKKCQLWSLTSFFSNFSLQFLDVQCQESTLFIRGGRETFCLHSRQILTLDSFGKDHNRWLKDVIMDCENWLLKDGRVGHFGVVSRRLLR